MALRQLLSISDLDRDSLYGLLENANKFVEISERELKKVPALRGKTIINLFLEPSTRTRASFEIAGKRLSADTINISGSGSSASKGETLLDTALTLQAMAPDVLVVRHSESGAPQFLARFLAKTAVVNAGDGMHEHPTQALLDCLTLYRYYQEREAGIEKLRIAIVGDIRHSRVARSNILAHQLLGNEVVLVGPPTLVPQEFLDPRAFAGRISICHRLREGLEGADVVMCLRMQMERQSEHFVPSLEEYSRLYCVNEKVLSEVAPDCVVMHPGPANRGVEISTEVMEGSRSLITDQVSNGVAVRMAILFALGTGKIEESIE